MNFQWKCFDCDVVAPFKGLCRNCTTYDDAGEILIPHPRIKIDSKGNVWKKAKANLSPKLVYPKHKMDSNMMKELLPLKEEDGLITLEESKED